jgi:hypothetical protein
MSNCTNAVLPVAHADVCDHGASIGQLEAVRFTRDDVGDKLPGLPTLVGSWVKIDNTSPLTALGTAAPIREMFVIGGKPAAQAETVPLPMGKKFSLPKDSTFVFKNYDVDGNWQAYQDCESNNGLNVQLWAFDASGMGFGGGDSGKAGISGTLTMELVIPESEKELKYFDCVFTFKGAIPTKFASPL